MATKKKPEHKIYGKNKTRKSPKEPEVESFAKKVDETKPSKRATFGLSLTDYQEVKVLGGDGLHDPFISKYMGVNLPKNYTPRMTTVPVNVPMNEQGIITGAPTPYTAAQVENQYEYQGSWNFDAATKPKSLKTSNKIVYPKFYQNPYQFQDYVYLQDIYANTIAGRIFDTIVHFALAKGIYPKLKLKNEEKFQDSKEKQKFLKEHKWMTDVLEEIDRNVSSSSEPKAFSVTDLDSNRIESIGPYAVAANKDTPVYDTSLQKKWAATMILALMFGRDCMVQRVDPEDNIVKCMIDEKEVEYKNIPKVILSIHPRDMGFNYVDYTTHKLLGIQLNNTSWILKPDEMMFWEWKPLNPVYGSLYYGMSAAQSMMGSARTLRNVIEVDFPLIAKTRWSGMYWIIFKNKGVGYGTEDAQLRAILQNMELNGINASLEDDPINDVMVHKIDLDPKIDELLQMVKDLVMYMQSQVGMPQGILYGENDLNRDTFSKKISTWTKGGLKPYREWFLEGVTKQWYRRMVKTLEEQDEKWKEAGKDIEVFADVEEYKLEDVMEQVQYINNLQNTIGYQFTSKAIGDMLGIEDIDALIDPEKELEVGMDNNQYTISENGPSRKMGVSGPK